METGEPWGTAADLREFLGERDAPCPGCGYNLRGLTGGRCPECGASLKLGVVAQRRPPAWAPWVRVISHPIVVFAVIVVGLGLAEGRRAAGLLILTAGAGLGLVRVWDWLAGSASDPGRPAEHGRFLIGYRVVFGALAVAALLTLVASIT